jgi:hypothetical protein
MLDHTYVRLLKHFPWERTGDDQTETEAPQSVSHVKVHAFEKEAQTLGWITLEDFRKIISSKASLSYSLES